MYAFIDSNLYGKAAFVWQTLAHVQKSRLVLVYSDSLPVWLQLWYVASTYYGYLLAEEKGR